MDKIKELVNEIAGCFDGKEFVNIDYVEVRVQQLKELVNKTNDINGVSQRSELLIDFAKWWDINTEYWEDRNYPKTVKKYIKSINCG